MRRRRAAQWREWQGRATGIASPLLPHFGTVNDIHRGFTAKRPIGIRDVENMNRQMDFRFPLALMLLTGLGLAAVAPVQAGTENSVMKLVEDGKILPLETIRRRVQSQVRGDYIGAEWDEATWTYRLRFVDNGNVINVDVDARTGQRVRRTANY
jgi:hypothetical protein